MHTVLERGRDAHRNPCAHSYCVPAPPHAEKYPILAHYVCISIAFLLFPSTFFRAHFYCVPALSACISIALQHSLHAFLLYPSTIFQHCMRAFLIYSSTFLVAFTHVCMCLYVFVPYTIYHPLHLLSSAYYPLCVFPLCTLCSMAPTLSAHCVQWCISKFENFQYSYLLSDREFGSRHLIFKY